MVVVLTGFHVFVLKHFKLQFIIVDGRTQSYRMNIALQM